MDCIRCKGNVRSPYSCGKKVCPILQNFKNSMPKIRTNFSGSSPPDLFVGQYNYPNVYTGILAPAENNNNPLSNPEDWFKNKFSINDILNNRGSMIYSRFVSNIKSRKQRLLETMQEVSMAKKPCSIEFFLAKKPATKMELNNRTAPIGNPAPLVKAQFQENPKVEKKVDYIVSDYDLKATESLNSLYQKDLNVSGMIKLLSAGLLGVKKQRKLVPTRWATTAVDDTISKNLLKDVKISPWINEFEVYHDKYLGNHYEIILMPRQWSFEVIEAKLSGSVWNQEKEDYFCQDFEEYYGRKTYAHNVSGAYYSGRLAIAENLIRRNRQASALVLREVSEAYYAPCGVGILREVMRSALNKKPERFNTLNQALNSSAQRLNIPISKFSLRSSLLKQYKQQKTLMHY